MADSSTAPAASTEAAADGAPSRRGGSGAIASLLQVGHHRLVRWTAAIVAVAVSAWSVQRGPHASWAPALVGLVPWVVGKYLLCPLRWHALSSAGRRRGWYLRTYAEGELLGLASPGHVGADLWRIQRLHAHADMARSCAVAEVALDRLVGALGLIVFVVL